jgi:hypothetical protein
MISICTIVQFCNNVVFGVYICALKEYIRLTYVDSIDRAALLEKMLWNFIATFDRIMEMQHRVNYEQFKEHRNQFAEFKNLFEHREQTLNEQMTNLKK